MSGNISCSGNLNVAGDLSFNNLNLSSNITWVPSGNFSYLNNTQYSDASQNEYGTICIGNIQIKFGYATNDQYSNHGGATGVNTITFTNPFPNQTIFGTGSLYGSGVVNVSGINNTLISFTNGGDGNYVYWIAIGD